MTLTSLATHFAKAPGAAAALIPVRKDWRATLLRLDDSLADAQQRRAALVAERDALIPDAVDGDNEARRAADKLEKHIEDLDREISRLHTARAQASARVSAESVAEAAERQIERREAIRALAKKWDAQAKKVDATVGQIVTDLAEFTAIGDEMRRLIAGTEIRHVIAGISTALPYVVSAQLSGTGYHFPQPPFLQAQKRKLAGWVPEPNYLVSLMAAEG